MGKRFVCSYNSDRMTPPLAPVFDLLVVGGGINGVGIARDAAGRGLKVLLVEKDDLAAHTSSASTKLIHGGLRYLEHYEFGLVRKSLIERDRLLSIAPHIIRPLQFVIPQAGSRRASWLVRLGLFLYDHIGGRKVLPATRTVYLANHPFGAGLRVPRGKAFVYADCWVDDSRLVVLNAVDAAERGADIQTRTEFVRAWRDGGSWQATLRDTTGEQTVRARTLINAAGPWVGELFARIDVAKSRRPVRLVKGSHIVLPSLFEGEQAYLIQNPDGRVVFAIPYEREFTLVGTTEADWTQAAGQARIDPAEIAYLLGSVRRTFSQAVEPVDIRWSYSGIRPLWGDNAANVSTMTRDYVLDLDDDGPPLLSIFGGKITTYRRLAEQALSKLSGFLPKGSRPWTAAAPLPGGELGGSFEDFLAGLATTYPHLPADLLHRVARSYGSRARQLLGDAREMADLGELFGAGLTRREVDYLVTHEWARTAEDILVRRSKLGLHSGPRAGERLQAYLQTRHQAWHYKAEAAANHDS
ncbi:glycerol-3-phosphate dehydrogenase [Sphingomonas sp. GCM10030256]|uniref:glycerol-3-phosphate dehydrogenase n=1 Tax=Sphingomonas sp. GCM10030256 TaxID=3273427 RepID=UPI0036206C2E